MQIWESLKPSPPSSKDASILLVDDVPANLVALHAILDDLGCHIMDARSGEEALEQVRGREFAVILLDVRMPGISGFETAQALRADQRTCHTPIIFLTANDIDQAETEEGYALGAVDFLTKPLSPTVVRAKVRGFVDLYLDKERARRESEQLRLLVHGTTDYAIFMLDPEGYIGTWNQGAERLKGYRAEEVIGQHFSRFYPQEAIDRGWPAHELKVATAVGRFEDEGWRIRKDGTRFWANVVITALKDEKGNLQGFSKVTRDLTERKAAEEILRRSEERFRLIVETVQDYAIFMLDPEGYIATWNQGAERLKGYRADEIIGQHFSRFYPQEAIDRGWPAHELKVATAVGRFEDEGWRIRKDGTRFWANVVITALKDEKGTLRGFSKVTRDLTERKEAEENTRLLVAEETARRLAEENARLVQAERERLHVTLASIGDAVISTDAEGRVNFLNPVAKTLVGWEAEEASMQPLTDVFRIVNESTRLPVENPALRALKEGVIVGLANHTVLIAKDGMERPIDDSAAPIRDAEGKVIGSVLVFRDISERKRVEQTARFLADASAALSMLVDFDSTLQKVATLAVPYFADWAAVDVLEEDGTLRRVAVAHADPTKVQWAHELHRRFPSGSIVPSRAESVVRTNQAEIVPEITHEFWTQSVKDSDLLGILQGLGLKSYIGVPLTVRSKTIGVLSFFIAESGHHYDEADLSVAQDLASRAAIAIENSQLYRELKDTDRRKDEFLATLAHELRNPLAPIHNGLQLLGLTTDLATWEQTREMMERQLRQMVRLVDDLLDVSRITRNKLELRKERVDLATIIHSAVETSRPLIEQAGHTFSLQLPTAPVILDADMTRLAQVFSNLLNNSAKYTEPSGHISVTAEVVGDQVAVRVRDNGLGIPAEDLPRLFKMFSQIDKNLERSQGGLGIGLTLVRRLVEMHGGTVEAHSEGLGKGAEFVVQLPLPNVQERHSRRQESPERRQGGSRLDHRLLVVDDNKDAALSLAMLLRLHGHEVHIVYDGYAALEAAKEYRPALVFLDIGMPGLDGYEVARRIRREPGLEKIVLTALTGWGQPEDRRRTADAGFDYHLVKPPDPAALEAILASIPRRP